MLRIRPKLLLICLWMGSTVLLAADKDFNRLGDGVWSDNNNWSPNGVPGSADDVFVGRAGFPNGMLLTLDMDDAIGTLTVLGGSRFTTGRRQLGVDSGPTTITGAGSAIFLERRTTGDFDSLDAEGVVISNGGKVQLIGGILELESGVIDIDSASSLQGHGTVELVQSGLGGSSVFTNNGRIAPGRTFFDPFDVTLTITNFDTAGGFSGTGSVDLDGTSGNGIVDVDDGTSSQSGNLTLVIQSQMTDAFDGTMEIGRGDTLDMQNSLNPWNLGTSGVINMNGATGTATLKGQALTIGSGSTLNVNSGIGRVETPLTALAGQLYVGPNSTLHLANTSSVHPTKLIFNSPSSRLEVSGNTNIISAGSVLDWDGQGGGATTTVSGNGQLTINASRIDSDDIFNGHINLEDSGQLSVTVADGRWDLASNASLSKSTGGTATLSGSSITVSGDIDVTAGNLVVNPDVSFGGAPWVTIAPASTLTLNGTTGFTNTDLVVNGRLQLNGNATWQAGGSVTGSGELVNEGSSRFAANTTIAVSRYNWDQGTTTVDPNVTLTIDVDELENGNDTFNNNIIRVNSGTVSVSVADGQWDLGGPNGILELNKTATAIPTLNGDRLNVQSGGEIRVSGTEVDINAPLTLQSGGNLVVQDPTRVNLDGPTTLAGGNITTAVGGAVIVQDGPLTVTGNSTISATTYDWDEDDTTVEPSGSLNINVTNIDEVAGQRYDRTLTMNSGNASVNVAGNVWTMDGTLRMQNTANDIPTLSGDTLFIGDGSGAADAVFRVAGTGTSRISAPTFYESDADVDVKAGAKLEHTSNVTFRGGGIYTGSGEMAFTSNVTVEDGTTIDMPGGKVDFTPAGDSNANTVSVNAPLTLDVSEFQFGRTTSGTHRMVVNKSTGGELNVFSGSGGWVVTPDGRLDLVGDSTMTNLVSGSVLDMQGVMNVDGAVSVSARQVLGGTVNLNVADQRFRLGGGTLANPNRIVGGTIRGPGRLTSVSGVGLHGNGIIDSDVEFVSGSELKADNGTLVINGDILGSGHLGTADSDGILNVTNPWSTSNGPLRMAGGEVTGSTITNAGSGSLQGHGLVSAPIVNTSSVSADGGLLNLANGQNNFSSASSQLNASQGNLEIQSTSGAIGGSMMISDGNLVTLSNNNFEFNSSANVTLNDGRLHATGSAGFLGSNLIVNGASASRINVLGTNEVLSLGAGTTVMLNNDLRVDAAGKTTIASGAVFSGSGALINEEAAELELAAGSDVGVTLINEGLVYLGGVSARADLSDYIQTDTGSLELGIAGTLLTDFDRMVISGAAQLDGILDVQLLSGFMPVLGDTFPVLSATGGILGSFGSELLPTLGNGLGFDLTYSSSLVSLEVVSTSGGGDVDGDGNIDGDDVDGLVAGIAGGSNDPSFDLTGDGIVDGDDLDQWLVVAGAANLPSGNAYLYGDASLDGFVDVADFNRWNSNKFTSTAAWTAGDFNADGAIDVGDFNRWNSNKFLASGDSPAAVPEPTSVMPLLLGMLLILGRRSRR